MQLAQGFIGQRRERIRMLGERLRPALLARDLLQNGRSESVLGIGWQFGRLSEGLFKELGYASKHTILGAPCLDAA